MTTQASPKKYDAMSMSLHWFIAILVMIAYGSALYREWLPKNDFRAWLLSFHMWLGMAVFGLTIIRLFWRAANPAPPHVPASKAHSLAAKLGHWALLAATIILPVIGLISAWYKARNVTFFNLLPMPSPFLADKAFGEQLEHMHSIGGHALMILAGGHAVIAIAHQYILRDGTLGRMVPFLSTETKNAKKARESLRAKEAYTI